LNNNGGATTIVAKGTPSYSTTPTTNDGMYSTTDDYGTSYYFRGAVNNNWVKFANIYWRIIRINGDNSIRMIYSGTTAPTSSTATVMTGTGTQIGTSYYNNAYMNSMYAGYMYTENDAHGYGTSSTIKTTIDTWYASNLSSYASYLSDSIFCNDRSSYIDSTGTTSGGGTGTNTSYFGSYIRLVTNKNPSLICPTQSDAFTVSDTTKGNAHLTNPIGLITADEISLAGGVFQDNESSTLYNTNYYLYTNQSYFSMTPGHYNDSGTDNTAPPQIFFLSNAGQFYNHPCYLSYGVRPVISLKSTVTATGTGVWNDPYIVQ
jgi:hypothetical protein